REWADDPARCAGAGVPEGTGHRTKPEIAKAMIGRALDAGGKAAWVVADEVYGASGSFRRALEERAQRYALAGRANAMPTTWPPYPPVKCRWPRSRRRSRRRRAGSADLRLGLGPLAPGAAPGLGPRRAAAPLVLVSRRGRLLPHLRP